MINIVFMGSGNFALNILKSLMFDPNINVLAVVTQPDKPMGRKKLMTPTPVGSYLHDIEFDSVFKCSKSSEILDAVDFTSSQLSVVVDYGVLLKEELLETSEFGTINIHPSPLPKYRGASPLQETLKNGDKKTAVAIQKMVLKMDAGPIYDMIDYDLSDDDDIESLSSKLSSLAALRLPALISEIVSGLKPIEQVGEVSFCNKISKEDGNLDLNKMTAKECFNFFRAFKIWPKVFVTIDGKVLKLIDFEVSEIDLKPYEFKKIQSEVYLGTRSGSLKLFNVQPESKAMMPALSFYNGYLS